MATSSQPACGGPGVRRGRLVGRRASWGRLHRGQGVRGGGRHACGATGGWIAPMDCHASASALAQLHEAHVCHLYGGKSEPRRDRPRARSRPLSMLLSASVASTVTARQRRSAGQRAGHMFRGVPATIWTVGYEKLLPPALVAELETAGVRRVIDVRFRPQSRRPGMSKTRLGALLAEHGIAYE